MIPLYSDKSLSSFPFVTILLILVNTVIFWFQLSGPGAIRQSVVMYGMIPYDLFHPGAVIIPGRIHPAFTLITSMFMHGGYIHLGSNMLYLWVFGRNVEDDFGHLRFLIFYIASGIIATVAFVWAFPAGTVPLVGASGAIAGVLGVYFLRFPASRIYCLIILFIFIRIIALPAFFVLGLWFVIQLGASMSSMTSAAGAAGHGGVAWISHVAGFVVGLVWTILELSRRFIRRYQ
ncbi:rhomboid family intramembrane serine protease [Candidatus Latescibacterota bacterium]